MFSPLSSNQRRFLRDLNTSGAEYVVIGGRAMQALGLPRRTSDLDLWVSHTGLSPDQLWAVLRGLIGENADSHIERLRTPNARLCIPSPENAEIDILTSVGTWDEDGIAKAGRAIESDRRDIAVLRRIE